MAESGYKCGEGNDTRPLQRSGSLGYANECIDKDDMQNISGPGYVKVKTERRTIDRLDGFLPSRHLLARLAIGVPQGIINVFLLKQDIHYVSAAEGSCEVKGGGAGARRMDCVTRY